MVYCMQHRASYNGPFQKHYFNYYKDSLMMATTQCRILQEEILCIYSVYIPVKVRLVLYVDFYTMHGTHTILHFLGRTDENHNAHSGQSMPQHIFKLGTSQIHDRSTFTSAILLNSDKRESFVSFISDHVIPYARQYQVVVCKTSAEIDVTSYCI